MLHPASLGQNSILHPCHHHDPSTQAPVGNQGMAGCPVRLARKRVASSPCLAFCLSCENNLTALDLSYIKR